MCPLYRLQGAEVLPLRQFPDRGLRTFVPGKQRNQRSQLWFWRDFVRATASAGHSTRSVWIYGLTHSLAGNKACYSPGERSGQFRVYTCIRPLMTAVVAGQQLHGSMSRVRRRILHAAVGWRTYVVASAVNSRPLSDVFATAAVSPGKNLESDR